MTPPPPSPQALSLLTAPRCVNPIPTIALNSRNLLHEHTCKPGQQLGRREAGIHHVIRQFSPQLNQGAKRATSIILNDTRTTGKRTMISPTLLRIRSRPINVQWILNIATLCPNQFCFYNRYALISIFNRNLLHKDPIGALIVMSGSLLPDSHCRGTGLGPAIWLMCNIHLSDPFFADKKTPQ